MSVFTTKYFTNADELIDDRVKNYTSEDYEEMTNFNNYITDKVKSDLKSTYTSTDYEGMTNLKNWVVSKIPSNSGSSSGGSSSSNTSFKVPVDICLCSATSSSYNLPHIYPIRITDDYILPTDSVQSAGLYVAFLYSTNSTNSTNYYQGIYIAFLTANSKINQCRNYDSSIVGTTTKFYKAELTLNTSDDHYNNALMFIFNDGSRAKTQALTDGLTVFEYPTLICVYSSFNADFFFTFDAMVCNIASRHFVAIDPGVHLSSNTTGADIDININGNEGSLTGDGNILCSYA